MVSRTIRFHPQTQKLQLHYISPLLTLGTKGLRIVSTDLKDRPTFHIMNNMNHHRKSTAQLNLNSYEWSHFRKFFIDSKLPLQHNKSEHHRKLLLNSFFHILVKI